MYKVFHLVYLIVRITSMDKPIRGVVADSETTVIICESSVLIILDHTNFVKNN